MRTIWQSLIWKDWHEHKWKLLALWIIMWSVTLLALPGTERGTLFAVRACLVVGIVPLAVFIGLGTAAGEQSRGTLRFLQALPVPMWRVALYKMGFGFATVMTPALLTLALAYAWVRCLALFGIATGAAADLELQQTLPNTPFPLGTNSWFLDSALLVLFVAGSFYLWTIAFGVSRKDEVSAGAVALAAIVGWGFLTCILVWFLDGRIRFAGWHEPAMNWIRVALVAIAPGGLAPVSEMVKPDWQLLLFGISIAVVVHLGFAGWYVARFGRAPKLEVRSPKMATTTSGVLGWLGPPRRSPLTAIVWKQLRESGPIVLAALVITALTLFLLPQPAVDEHPGWTHILPAVSMTIGFCLAIVMGIGVALNDSKPGLNTFWRSRPIDADLWFWLKFLAGLSVLLTAVYGPMLLFARPAASEPDAYLYPTMHIALYAAAVAMTALVGQAVYAAILSIAVAYAGITVTAFVIWVGARLGWGNEQTRYMEDLTTPQITATMLVTFALCTLLAWLAVRNDWGQKNAR